MQYVEVQSLEKHAEKIEKQLNLILKTKPGIYAKTKDRYKQIAYSLLKSAEMISSILEEESLVPQIDSRIDDEFNELNDSTSLHSMQELQDTANAVNEKIENCSHFTSSDSSGLSNKEVMRIFASTIQDCANQSFEYIDIAKCATILNRWIQSRFYPLVRNPNFRYNIKQLPAWITYMIIAFGKYKHNNDTEGFIEIVDRWIHSIEVNLSNTYTVPYEVFELMKSNDANDFTVEAVLISDILLESGLYKLTDSSLPDSDVYLTTSPVLDVVKQKNPQLIPILKTRYARQEQLLKEYNFN